MTSADASANSRLTTWRIAWQMAGENPIFGLGIRNSNLYTYDYGADMPGRTIHSQYLQTAADSGLVGLGLYLAALFIAGGVLLPVGIFLIHYVGLTGSPFAAIGWASVLADSAGALLIIVLIARPQGLFGVRARGAI